MRRRMRRDQFEKLSVKEVRNRALREKPVQSGKPLYHDRPWSELLDEMDGAEARTVNALSGTRIEALHAAISRPER